MKLTPKQQLVYDVILLNPGVQNNESDLIEAVWRYEGWDDSKGLSWNISRVTHAETISRRRRELYNLGLITYSDQALKSRTEACKKEQNAHSTYEEVMAAIVKPKFIMKVVDGERIMVRL